MARTLEREPACAAVCRSLFRRPHHLAPAGLSHHPRKGVKDVAAYQMDDGNFDIYLKTSKGKRYVQASNDFRTFKEDTLEASADEILWQRDTATIDGKLFQGCDFEVPAVHLNYIRSWFHAL